MMGNIVEKQKNLLPLAVLPLILLVTLSLWIGLAAERYRIVYSHDGVWDLRGFDFANNNARLQGYVEFIPGALLTPEEFAEREAEIIVGYTHEVSEYATSRVRLLLPDDSFHTFSRISTDFSDRIFVNGRWLHDVGLPADNREDAVPFTARVTFTARANNVGGYYIIEVIQQTANLGMRGRGVFPQDWRVGEYAFYNTILRADYSVNIVLGAYIALFLSFMLLFILMKGYRPNLYFALFCLVWFMRTGVTSSARVFAVLVPWLPGIPSMRIEYVALPLTAILLLALIRELFPDILQNNFYKGVMAIYAVFAVVFLVGEALLIGIAILLCQIFIFACIIYVVIRFCRKLRKPNPAQYVFVIGAIFFLYSAVRDFTYYSFHQFALPPFAGTNLTQIAMLAFAFCQATAVFIATMNKVEAAKADKAASETLSRMKTEFLATVSHELKTPLGIISNNAQLARMRSDNEENAYITDKMQRITSETERMSIMVNQLLDVTRIEEGRMSYNFVPTDASVLIRDTMDTFYPVLNKNKNTLTLNLPSGLPPVRCDRERIRQVLLNLVSNANRFTKSGTITVSAEAAEEYVCISVTDTGEGIPKERIGGIFDRYTTANPESDKNPSGTGLGLYISKHIIKAHGGTISAASEKGQGTVMTFTLATITNGDENDG